MYGGSLYNGVIVTKDMANNSLTYVSDTVREIVSSSSTTISDPSAVDGHFFFGEIYEFYRSYFSRQSFNNSRHNITAYIHLGRSYENAFWQPVLKAFFFGDGDGDRCLPLIAANDICCHEFQHAVTTYTANLEYEFQSGALNEAYSDIAASVFDPDWSIGEDCAGPGFLRVPSVL
jgi:Zn-dependent metalloprotease